MGFLSSLFNPYKRIVRDADRAMDQARSLIKQPTATIKQVRDLAFVLHNYFQLSIQVVKSGGMPVFGKYTPDQMEKVEQILVTIGYMGEPIDRIPERAHPQLQEISKIKSGSLTNGDTSPSFSSSSRDLRTDNQLRNVKQILENGRIVVTYDLQGNDEDRCSIKVIAANKNGDTINPVSVAGDIIAVAPGQRRTISWNPEIEGLTPTGWEIVLIVDFSITWVLVEGGPGGDYYISATEITFEQYDKFCEATEHTKPQSDFGRGKQPVINVNVPDAVAFCEWLSKETGTTVRLPEENEWEYAARGGKKSRGYLYSGSKRATDVAWCRENSGLRTHEVASKKENELGIFDMSGNVFEWCGTSGAVRGGFWGLREEDCRLSDRYDLKLQSRGNFTGFRVIQKR